MMKKKMILPVTLVCFLAVIPAICFAVDGPLVSRDGQWTFYDFGGLGGSFKILSVDSDTMWLHDRIVSKFSIGAGRILKTDLLRDEILSSYDSGSGTVWIGTLEKLYKFRNGEIAEEIAWPDGKWFEAKEITVDEQGDLSVLSHRQDEIIKYSNKSWQRIKLPDYLGKYDATHFGIDSAGRIYVSSYLETDILAGRGTEKITVFDRGKWRQIYERKIGPDGIGLVSFIQPFQNDVYVGVGKGLWKIIDGKLVKVEDDALGKFFLCAKIDKEGVLWLGTTDGIYRYQDGSYRFFKNPLTRGAIERVIDIGFDNSGNVWMSHGTAVSVFRK